MANKKTFGKGKGKATSGAAAQGNAKAIAENNPPKPASLSAEIEVNRKQPSAIPTNISSTSSDALDKDLASHIQIFAETWNKDLELPPITLMTAEKAQEALNIFNDKLLVLEKKLKVVRSLRSLLENNR